MAQAAPFSISRTFNAPRELVYQMHSAGKHLAGWLAPEGFTNIHSQLDLKVGGSYHYGLSGPNGVEIRGRQVYREIIPNEKLVFIQSFSDRDGGLARHPMADTWPLEMLATVVFEDAGTGMTKVTNSWQPYHSDEAGNATFDKARSSMEKGFTGTFDKLEAYLAEVQRGA